MKARNHMIPTTILYVKKCLCQNCENIEPKRRHASYIEKKARPIKISVTYGIPEYLGHVKIFS